MEIYLHDIKASHRPSRKTSEFPDTTIIQLFGVLQDGSPTYVEVKGFKPWFYLKSNCGKSLSTIKSELSSEFWFRNASSCKIVRRKQICGFSDDIEFDYLMFEFKGMIPIYSARKKITEIYGDKVSLYEVKIEPCLKFFHCTKIKPSSYFMMETFTEITVEVDKKSNCKREFRVKIEDLVSVMEDRTPPPMTICAYDIESSGLDPRTNHVFQVSMCFSKVGDSIQSEEHASTACKDGMVICVGPTESIEGTPIVEVDNELELLSKFRDIMIDRGVSILIGYNNNQFDAQFLYKRARDVYNFSGYKKIGFLKDEEVPLTEKVLESSALGRNELSQVVIPGRVEYDGLMILRRGYKLNSYKLNAVCEHFFGGTKDDITYSDIVEACTTKDPHKLGVIAKYCYQDSWLVLKLVDKIKEIYNSMEMSKLCTVPVEYILNRGQQIKCYSLILDRTYGGYVCNYTPPDFSKEDGSDDKGYQGATVIDACKGFYPDDPIVTMDFASLYPSIMIWKNLCYTTHVQEDKYRGIPGVSYEDYELAPGVIETFAHRPGTKGLLAIIEKDLLGKRKITKKQMKSEKDKFKYSLLDSKQLAQKVTCNSLYGFTGTTKGMLPLKAIAAAVTCTGRDMIRDTSDFVHNKLGGKVVYGDTDSVMVIFPVPSEIKEEGDSAVMNYLFKVGSESAAKITGIFGDPVLLEFENIYTRYLLVSKKRYAGMSWATPEGPPTMTMKGLVTVRRDNAPIVAKCATRMLDMLMKSYSNDDIFSYINETLGKLESGTIPIQDITIRKELKKWDYKNPVPHSVLAHKIIDRSQNQRLFREYIKPAIESETRYDDSLLFIAYSKLNTERMKISFGHEFEVSMKDFVSDLRVGKYSGGKGMAELEKISTEPEGHFVENGIKNMNDLSAKYQEHSSFEDVEWDAPRLGDRIPYVVVRGKGDVNQRCEDPSFVSKKKGLKVDTCYYMTRQLKNPISDLMKLFIDPKVHDVEELFKGYIRRASNVNEGRMEITGFFKSSGKIGIEKVITLPHKKNDEVREKNPGRQNISDFFKPALKRQKNT